MALRSSRCRVERRMKEMILDSFDSVSRTMSIDIVDTPPSELARRLASLAMVSSDCGIDTIICRNAGSIEGPLGEGIRFFMEHNPLFKADESLSAGRNEDDFGYWLVTRDEGILCLGDSSGSEKYSIFLSPDMENVGKASIFAYLIANITGFSSFTSFEIRFSIYEILANIVGNGNKSDTSQWIRISIGRNEDKLSVTILDKGIENDPTRENVSSLSRLYGSGIFRGLGLKTANRLIGLLRYEREDGTNRTFFDKTGSEGAGDSIEGGEDMPRFRMKETSSMPGEVAKFRLEGDLDSNGALVLEAKMAGMLRNGKVRAQLDFEDVRFISSAGVGILLGMVSSFRSDGGDVTFNNLSPKIVSVLRLLNLEQYFNITESREPV